MLPASQALGSGGLPFPGSILSHTRIMRQQKSMTIRLDGRTVLLAGVAARPPTAGNYVLK